MKNLAFVTVLVSLVFAMACGGGSVKQKISEVSDSITDKVEGATTPIKKKIPFEHGTYVQKSEAMGMEYKETVYFDKWGEWTATEKLMEMTMMGYTHVNHTILIIKGKTHWLIDLVNKTGQQWEGGGYVSTGMGDIDVTKEASKMAEGMKMEDLGTVQHLGYTCRKIRTYNDQLTMDATTISYGTLAMKTEGKAMGMEVKTEIISIDLTPPPASIFEVPEGIEIQKL
jgi:hypothetical protein